MDTRTTRRRAEGIVGVLALKQLEADGMAVVTTDAARLIDDLTPILRAVLGDSLNAIEVISDLKECAQRAAIYGLLR